MNSRLLACTRFIVFILFLSLTGCATNYASRPDVKQFVNQMSVQHQFDKNQLLALFKQIKPNKKIIRDMTTPHEAMPWYTYRTIFLTPKRAQEGADFWRAHAQTLAYAEKYYGVPAEIIVAILGVETRYGQFEGKYKAFDAISTLAFDYPARSKYFKSELEQYLLLTRDAGYDPLSIRGSYAGALGAPQFMPSSYRRYAISYSGKGFSNLFTNDDDAIVSVANYFKGYGWQPGGPIAAPARVVGDRYEDLPTSLKPTLTLAELAKYGVYPTKHYSPEEMARLVALASNKDNMEYWIGFHNFYVITRYNTSSLYAMAVYQLSEWIRRDYYQTVDS